MKSYFIAWRFSDMEMKVFVKKGNKFGILRFLVKVNKLIYRPSKECLGDKISDVINVSTLLNILHKNICFFVHWGFSEIV